MPVFYRLHKSPTPRKDGKVTPYHPRFVNQTTARMDKIVALVSGSSIYSETEVVGVLTALKKVIALELSDGRNVELEGFGTFTVSLKCPPFCDKNLIRTKDVEFRTVRMRVAADFKKRVRNHIDIKKAEDVPSDRLRLTQRRKILLEHIEEHQYITAKEYRLSTHLYKSAAARDLKRFINEGLIVKKGSRTGTFYMFPPHTPEG
ncbi:MAG: HU family DNA-binding protein [Tannerellaceae bacterium]|nr:HU family DNA-binding protein [Tannerellaceae bacterium]